MSTFLVSCPSPSYSNIDLSKWNEVEKSIQSDGKQTLGYFEARKMAVELIKKYESFSPTIYVCVGGQPTLGYGLANKYIKGRTTITKKQAEKDLEDVYDEIYSRIEKRLGFQLKQQQMASLVSFAFNLGEGTLYNSTMFKRLKENDLDVGNEFKKFVYTKVNGEKKKLKGLELRRNSELELFNL